MKSCKAHFYAKIWIQSLNLDVRVLIQEQSPKISIEREWEWLTNCHLQLIALVCSHWIHLLFLLKLLGGIHLPQTTSLSHFVWCFHTARFRARALWLRHRACQDCHYHFRHSYSLAWLGTTTLFGALYYSHSSIQRLYLSCYQECGFQKNHWTLAHQKFQSVLIMSLWDGTGAPVWIHHCVGHASDFQSGSCSPSLLQWAH